MRKSGKKSIWKNVGFYFVLIYALFTLGMIVQIFTVSVVPVKYAAVIVAALLLLFILLAYLQLGKKVNKINKLLGKILIIILCLFLGVGNWYLYTTQSAFKRMTGDDTQTNVVSVVVMKDSSYQTLSDLKGKKFGITSLVDQGIQDQALEEISEELGNMPLTISYGSYKDFGDDLYEGKVDCIVLNEATRGMFDEYHADFDEKTRVITQYSIEQQMEDISKDVDVTQDPFNVYITGIDTYGSLTTVSRSDVNMIVSVNPQTHQILLTGIPRDFYVKQPCQGDQKDKLTHTGMYGVECTLSTVENFMNIEINYYARVNFDSVVNIVDALGGISVESPFAFTLGDGYQIVQGTNNLNGEHALAFARERYSFADGDRERSRNQMRVVTAMINKAISPSIITNYTSILNAVSDSVQTNMSQDELTSFIKKQLNDMKGWNIRQIQVSGTGTTDWSPANGFNSYMMVPDEACVENAMKLIQKINSGGIINDDDIALQNELVANVGYN